MVRLIDTLAEIRDALVGYAMGDSVWFYCTTGWTWFDDLVNEKILGG